MFTAAESAEIWDRWQRDEGLKLIGRVFGRSSGAIFQHLKPHGGICPVPRRRSRRVLSMDEREERSGWRVVAVDCDKKDLQAHLRSGPAIRRSRHASSKSDARGSLTDIISTRERPASVEDRAVPGHWEGDLL
jgi:hypothetical protein